MERGLVAVSRLPMEVVVVPRWILSIGASSSTSLEVTSPFHPMTLIIIADNVIDGNKMAQKGGSTEG